MMAYLVKLDVTALQCTICNTPIEDIKTLVNHLIVEHKKSLHTNINDHILQLKFEDSNDISCVLCSNKYSSFKAFVQHMNMHYRNYICEICNAGFVNKSILKCHLYRHKRGVHKCSFCNEIFDTSTKKRAHEKVVHMGIKHRWKCPYCEERFAYYNLRNLHIVNEHGLAPNVFKCQACDKSFNTNTNLTRHTRKDHLMERLHKCSHCEMRFFDKRSLNDHLTKHSNAKDFQCKVCHKCFSRKKSLHQHLRIHEGDKRYDCIHCHRAFVQKCSLNYHLRSKHGDISIK